MYVLKMEILPQYNANFYDLLLGGIPTHSLNMLHKTVHEMVEFSGRWVYFIQFFYFDAGIPLTGSFSMVPDLFG